MYKPNLKPKFGLCRRFNNISLRLVTGWIDRQDSYFVIFKLNNYDYGRAKDL